MVLYIIVISSPWQIWSTIVNRDEQLRVTVVDQVYDVAAHRDQRLLSRRALWIVCGTMGITTVVHSRPC